MKNKHWAALLIFLLVVCLGLSLWLLRPDANARRVQIMVGGKTERTVDLTQDQTFTLASPDGGYNTITVKNGRIAVTEADCPDGYCVKRGFCSGGAQIVCLPHRLVIHFLDAQTVDSVAG